MRLLKISLNAFLLLFSVIAVFAGMVPAPNLVSGKYVYTIPEGFDPPMIGNHGMNEIQESAGKLHYPYYVIFIEELPEDAVRKYGEEDAAAMTIDGIAEDWMQQFPNYDAAKSSIFILAYNPRQYRFLAGVKWKNDLGFERSAHDEYTALFERSVKGTPKDPKTGIINMMNAVDTYLYDNTDPVRLEARRKAEEKAAYEESLRNARLQLENEVQRLNKSLNAPSALLPSNIESYKSNFDKADSVKNSDSAEQIASIVDSLKTDNDKLSEYINAKRADKNRKQMNKTLKIILLILLLYIAIRFTLKRKKHFNELKDTFDRLTDEWDKRLLNAKTRYADFYGNERSKIVGLSDMKGETQKLYEKVASEVDAIYLGVEAMEAHIASMRMQAEGASYINIAPLIKVVEGFDNEFEYDTGKLNPSNLFEPITKILKIKPTDFLGDLETRFTHVVEDWEFLKKAFDVRMKSAEELFPHTKLDEMLKTADENGIPHAWLKEHPLFGSDEDDRLIYGEADVIQDDDPVGFMLRVDSLLDSENAVENKLNRLVAAIKNIKECIINEPPEISPTIILPQDDPKMMYEDAKLSCERFEVLLSGRTGNYDIDEVEAQAENTCRLYKASVDQAVLVNNVVSNIGDKISRVKHDFNQLKSSASEAENRLIKAQTIHEDVSAPKSSFEYGNRFSELSRQSLELAETHLNQMRHMDADKALLESLNYFNQGIEKYKLSIAQCEELDMHRVYFFTKIEELENEKVNIRRRIKQYGGNCVLEEIPPYDIKGPANYLTLLKSLELLQQNWNSSLDKAHREYMLKDSVRRSEERRRQRDDDDDSFGSSRGGGWSSGGSSSSGSSWSSGSGSSSSGSSWSGGGGRSSSSGGSW